MVHSGARLHEELAQMGEKNGFLQPVGFSGSVTITQQPVRSKFSLQKMVDILTVNHTVQNHCASCNSKRGFPLTYCYERAGTSIWGGLLAWGAKAKRDLGSVLSATPRKATTDHSCQVPTQKIVNILNIIHRMHSEFKRSIYQEFFAFPKSYLDCMAQMRRTDKNPE